jgi:hypothetical protein
MNIEVVQTVGVILRLVPDFTAPRFQFVVQSVHVSHKDVDRTVRVAAWCVGRSQMNDHPVIEIKSWGRTTLGFGSSGIFLPEDCLFRPSRFISPTKFACGT